LITNATQAEEILQKDEADVILLARELLRNPYFVAKSSWENNQVSFFLHNTKEVNLK
jgi:2,4-dienoyl-CoA reductase-like NADH-dependent reductase (Old Yellow Enzyme family)